MNRTPTLLLEHLPAPGQSSHPDKAQSHHLVRVLRLRSGQSLVLLDGKGGRAHAVLETLGSLAVLHVETLEHLPAPSPALEAWLPLIRETRLEWAVEKLVELAVGRIRLYTSARTGDKARPPDLARLSRVRQAAVEQCGLAWLPPLEAPRPLEELLATADRPLVLADPRAAGEPPRGCDTILLAGPEGGFDPEEHTALLSRAHCRVSFGGTVLRAETALVALAAHLRTLA